MSSLVILFVALTAVISMSNNVEGSSVQVLDLNKILKLVQRERLNTGKQHRLRLSIVSSDSNSESDSDESLTDLDESDDFDNNGIERLRKERIVNLLETIANEKTNSDRITYRKGKKNYGQTSDKSDGSDNKRLSKERIIDLLERVVTENNKNDRITNRKEKPIYRQTSYLVGSENYDSAKKNVQKQILEKLFSQASNDEERQSKPKKRLIPNRLTPTVTMNDVKKYYENKNKKDESIGLEDYSKIYIVLNPQAVRNSKNKNALNDLISKVVSLSSSTSKREDKTMPRRYKGFVVNETNPRRQGFKAVNDNTSRTPEELKLDPLADSLGGITAMST